MNISERKSQIVSQIERSFHLLEQLDEVYRRDLHEKCVSDDAKILTHEVIEKCSNILDQAMSFLFDERIKPKLSVLPQRGGYYPATADEQGYKSTLGQWKASDLGRIAPEIDAKLRSLQPFVDPRNAIYKRIKDIAAKKHTGLLPQTKLENKTVRAQRIGGGPMVQWNPAAVRFGPGVRIAGVPVNPQTQLPEPNQNVDVTITVWVRFLLEDSGEDAFALCRDAVDATKAAVNTLLMDLT